MIGVVVERIPNNGGYGDVKVLLRFIVGPGLKKVYYYWLFVVVWILATRGFYVDVIPLLTLFFLVNRRPPLAPLPLWSNLTEISAWDP